MSISPTDFLNQPSDPDEPEGPQAFSTDWATGRVWQVSQPHDLLAPLERIANALEGQSSAAAEEGRLRENFTLMTEEIEDLHAKYESLFGLVADVEKLVAKSTSKLANSVRDAINGWKAPVAGPLRGAFTEDGEVDPIEEIASPVVQPAHDASVEEWRAYARSCPNRLDTGVSIDAANRSQIRTMLGMAQTGSDTDA